MSELLDAFTKLVAYLGDEAARDGYGNGNINLELEPEEINAIVKNIYRHLNGEEEINAELEDDVRVRVKKFIDAVEAGPPEQKPELFEYMEEYDAEPAMQGGARKKRGKRKRKTRGKRKTPVKRKRQTKRR